jgi:hypothetical protein
MISGSQGRIGLAAWLAAAGIIIMQAAALNYGTRINDLPFIRDYRITGNVVANSGLERDHLIGSPVDRKESLDLWMVRFKLYSVEADEVDNIIALARIKPAQGQFDPKFYQYGGAFLYPLGAWYFVLSKLGLVHVAPLDQLLANPQAMDQVWIAGRAFVVTAFAASAFLLFLMLIEVASAPIALAALTIYLFCPASIMFSEVIKPHWYALLWINCALLIVVRAFVRSRLSLSSELLLAAALGLAVGSVVTNALMSVLIWCALIVLTARGKANLIALVRVPAIAGVVFFLTNPYYFLNWQAAQAERATAGNWFSPSLDPAALLMFVTNSLFSGYGIVLTGLMLVAMAWHLLRGPNGTRLLVLAIALPIVLIAILTTSIATWSVNFRYIPYVLPATLLLVALAKWRHQGIVLGLCAVATLAQAAPLKLAYFDENNDINSTRLSAAAWIDQNIPKSDAVCVGTETLVPYDVPPFRFDRYKINSPDCRWLVQIEREPRAVQLKPQYDIEKRFVPRFSPQLYPLVWEHINPQITIYRKIG